MKLELVARSIGMETQSGEMYKGKSVHIFRAAKKARMSDDDGDDDQEGFHGIHEGGNDPFEAPVASEMASMLNYMRKHFAEVDSRFEALDQKIEHLIVHNPTSQVSTSSTPSAPLATTPTVRRTAPSLTPAAKLRGTSANSALFLAKVKAASEASRAAQCRQAS